MQRWPEAIARSPKMVPDGRRVQSGIDAAKQNAQVFGDQVGKGLVRGGGNLFFGRFERLLIGIAP